MPSVSIDLLHMPLSMFSSAMLPRITTISSLRTNTFCFSGGLKSSICIVLLPNTGRSVSATNFDLTSWTILQGASIACASQCRNHYPLITTTTVSQITQLRSLQSMNVTNVHRIVLPNWECYVPVHLRPRLVPAFLPSVPFFRRPPFV